METVLPLLVLPPLFEFKSYYVVWKRMGFLPKKTISLRLNRTMQYGNEKKIRNSGMNCSSLNRTMQYGNTKTNIYVEGVAMLFKSYYVVWKPEPDGSAKSCVGGLNRTMQYGNYSEKSYFYKMSRLFKSYYVVWKLSSRFC